MAVLGTYGRVRPFFWVLASCVSVMPLWQPSPDTITLPLTNDTSNFNGPLLILLREPLHSPTFLLTMVTNDHRCCAVTFVLLPTS